MAQQSDSGLKERFFRYFQHEVTALQEEMDRLKDTAVAGGERQDAVEHCLAGIARLSKEVKDASAYIPAYDQRTYAEAIKALSERLQGIRNQVAPKAKFSFKTAHKNNSAISINDAAELASQQRARMESNPSSAMSSMAPTPANISTPANEPASDAIVREQTTETGRDSDQQYGVRKPSFSRDTSVSISNKNGIHIILPPSAAHATTSGTLSNLRRCIVDMSVPTASERPFAGLALKNVKESLIVCGHVAGPAHVTNVQNSVIVVACRQFRMHDCNNVDVYLQCGSRPIIEDCEGIRFAPLPEAYLTDQEKSAPNQWDQVDDFKWLKSEPSPHWTILPYPERTKDGVWKELVPGGPGFGLEEILQAVSVRA